MQGSEATKETNGATSALKAMGKGFLKKVTLPHDPAIPLLGRYPKAPKTGVQKKNPSHAHSQQHYSHSPKGGNNQYGQQGVKEWMN